MIECENCGKSFNSERGLHCHLKVHELSVAEYYEKYHPRFDLYTKKPIKYKTHNQYMTQDFNSKSNMVKWLNKFEPEDPVAQAFLEEKLVNKLKDKNTDIAPPNLYLSLSDLPEKKVYDLHFGSYQIFTKGAGLKHQLYKDMPNAFWKKDLPLDDLPILIDTREQKPLDFNNSQFHKLDFGDYTAGGNSYTSTFVERKSAADFASTMSNGIDRFRKEVERCVEFNSYLFIVVESTPEKIYPSVCRNFKPNMDYIWHNVRELILDYPKNIQFLFVYNRKGAYHIVPRLLYFGKDLWNVDVQYYLQEKVKVCSELKGIK